MIPLLPCDCIALSIRLTAQSCRTVLFNRQQSGMPEFRLRQQKTISRISIGIEINSFGCDCWFRHPIK